MAENNLEIKITADTSGAIKGMVDVSNATQQFADHVVTEVGKAAAAFFAFHKMVDALFEGIGHADEMRDLTNSLAVFTGSMGAGTEVMRRFEEQARHTRNTASELGVVFRDLLPMGGSRGFSQAGLAEITVELSKLATVAGTTIEAMRGGFESLLAGKVSPGKNPLLSVLGFTKENVGDLTWEEVDRRMKSIAAGAEQFGQSWDSTMHKVKDAWLDAFGEGFNESMGNTREGFDGLHDTLTDQSLTGGIKDIGAEVGKLADNLKYLHTEVGAVKAVFNEFASSPGYKAMVFMHQFEPGALMAKEVGLLYGLLSKGADALTQSHLQQQQAGLQRAQYTTGIGALQDVGLARYLPNLGTFGSVQTSGFEGGDAEFARVIGITRLTASAPQMAAFMAEIKKAAQDGAVSVEEYTTAWQKVFTTLEDVHRGLVAVDNGAKDGAKALAEEAKTFSEIFRNIIGGGMHGGYMGGTGQPIVNAADLAYGQLGLDRVLNRPMPYLGLTQTDPALVEETKRIAIANGIAAGKAQASAFYDATVNSQFLSDFSNSFASIIEGGGRNFTQVLSQGFRGVIQDSAKELSIAIFGTAQLDEQGRPTGRMVDASGRDITGRATGARIGMEALQIGATGYEAGLSGAPGSRTSAVASGFMAGLSSGNIYVAIAGAIIGAIGGALGAQQRQADYQYGIPTIDATGMAHLTQDRNLVPARIKEIEAQIQAQYNLIHDGLIDLLLKFPDLAIPKFDEITGKFQENPSAHWGEHLQQWITGTLPREMMGALGDEIGTGFAGFGMSPEKFKELWGYLQKLDPSKAIGLLGSLGGSLGAIQNVYQPFFNGNNAPDMYTGGRPGSATYQQYMGDLSILGTRTPGQLIGEQDADILKRWSNLHEYSPERQIQEMGVIEQMMKQRYDTEKQAIQEIYNTAKSLHQLFAGSRDTYSLEGMVDDQGQPDYQGRVDYAKKKADEALQKLHTSSSAADVSRWSQEYDRWIHQTEQFGIQSGGNVRDWTQWGIQQTDLGETEMQATLDRLGISINTINDTFNNGIDPALQAFLTNINAINGGIGGPGGGDGPEGPGVVPALSLLDSAARSSNVALVDFATRVKDTFVPLDMLGGAIENLVARINAVQLAGSSSSSSSGFAQRTVYARLSG